MDVATEYRRRVNDWLHTLVTAEFSKLDYSLKQLYMLTERIDRWLF